MDVSVPSLTCCEVLCSVLIRAWAGARLSRVSALGGPRDPGAVQCPQVGRARAKDISRGCRSSKPSGDACAEMGPVSAHNLPTARTPDESRRQSLKRHKAPEELSTHPPSSSARQGPRILAPALPFTATDPWASHFPSLGLSFLPCKSERVGLMERPRPQGAEPCSHGGTGTGDKAQSWLAGWKGRLQRKGET